ncbi:MAG: hypothetical protein HYS25_00870 [Ignavibacteriales bacterium]|nr:hypothetical protein [Ignavibacteriales bacterium]
MANANNELIFELMIDGKEAIATLDLTKGEFVETGAAAEATNEKIKASIQDIAKKFNDISNEAKTANQSISQIGAFAGLGQNLGKNFDGVNVTIKDLVERLRDLKTQFQSVPIGGEEYTRRLAQIKEIETELEKVQAVIRATDQTPAFQNLNVEAQKYGLMTQENTEQLKQYILTQGLSADAINDVIQSLDSEVKTLAINSEAWKQKVAASTNLKSAYGQLITQHNELGGAQQKVIPGMNSMNNAMGQFGYLVSDADMFLVNYQMGLRSIGNNIPMVVQYMQYAKQEASGLNMTLGQAFMQSIKGPGGILLGINAVVFAMQILAKFTGDSTAEVKMQKEEIDKLRESYQKLSKQQLDSKEMEIRGKLSTEPYVISKGIPQFGIGPEQIFTSESGKKLKEQLDTLIAIKNNMGDLEKLENRRTELNEKIKKLKNIDDGLVAPYSLDLLKQYQDELKKIDDRIKFINGDENNENKERGINSLASEKAKYEELKGKIIEVGIQKDKELSDYQKELVIIEQLKNAKLEALDAEEKTLQTKKAKTPADEQKIKNIELEKQIAQGEADVQTEKLKKDHDDKMLDLDFQLAEQKMQLEKKTNAEILQFRIDHYKKLLELETDPEKRAALELKIGAAQIEGIKNTEEGKKFFDQFKAKAEANPYEQQKEELKVEEELSVKRAEMYGATEEQKTNIHNYYTHQREAIDRQSQLNTLSQTSQMLGQLAGLFSKHTAAYKLLATTQVMIETYKGVMALYAPPPVGVGPVLAPFMTAAVIGTGIANAANIMKQDTTMKGYARGGAIVGEKGMEIIAPAEDYASGMAELVTRTAFEVRNYFNGGTGNDNGRLIEQVRILSDRIEYLASRPTRAYFDNDEALKVGQYYDYEQRTGR